MGRLFTVCYLPNTLIWLGVMVRWPRLATNQTRILTGFIGFSAILLAVPLVSKPDRRLVKLGAVGVDFAKKSWVFTTCVCHR